MVLLLKRAKRARVSFEPSGESLDGMSLIIDTELIRYKWVSVNGNFPDWEKLIPTEHQLTAHFDTVEAIKAVSSLKAIADSKAYPVDLAISDGKLVMANPDDKGQAELAADTDGQGFIRVDGSYLADAKAYPVDLTIGGGKIVMANPDDKGQAELVADTDGEGFIRVDGGYLADALKACGGMVDFKLTNASSPMLFSANGYQLVVMPMMTTEANEQAKKAREAKAKAEPVAEPVAEAEPVVEKPKGKRNRAKEPVTAK